MTATGEGIHTKNNQKCKKKIAPNVAIANVYF